MNTTGDKISMVPLPAATVVLLRDHPHGPQVFMLKRVRGNAFTVGAYVFVGGRVDQKDATSDVLALCDPFEPAKAARVMGLDSATEAAALYIAALRETFEEAGLLIGRPTKASRSRQRWAEVRHALNSGRCSFAQGLQQLAFVLRPFDLRYLAHWITPPQEPRRFDTRFFVCRAPEQQQAAVDGAEALEARWIGIDELLRAQRQEQIKLAPPTYCVLEDLGGAPDVASMLARAPNRPITPIHPRLVGHAHELNIILPGDSDYDEAASPGRRNRVVRVGSHWELRRSTPHEGTG